MVNDHLLVYTANQVHEGRISRGLSQTDLAKLVGTTRQSISAYEKAEFLPRFEIMLRLSRELKFSLDQFQSVEGG